MSELVLENMLDNGILQLTLNRPDRHNALNNETLEQLIERLGSAKDNEDARVVVLTGAGEKAFCAGGDLSPGGGMSGGMLPLHYDRLAFVDLFRAMRSLGKPIIARVQGHCLGGGLGLMLGCDLAIAAERATFGTPEIRVGLFPMMIMTLIFRNIGRKAGMEMIFTGERMSAEWAVRVGLVNKVVPDDELDSTVMTLAKKIAGYSPAILKLGRDAFYAQEDMPLEQALAFLHSQLTINTLAEDAAEGVAAFIGKREPEWKGK